MAASSYHHHHHHHQFISNSFVSSTQNANNNNNNNNSSFVVQSSVNEMILSQLELLKRETERVIVRPCHPSSFQSASSIIGVERTVPTYRAILAHRQILVKEKIGSGSYSKVRLAFRLSSTLTNNVVDSTPDDFRLETVAVKIVDRRRAPKDYQTRFMPRELDIWATLRHPNVVRLHETFSDPLERFVFMVSEYVEGGDCLRYVQRVGSLKETTACHWVAQLCCGVRYMHAKGVCHRDLKLENLFLERDASRIRIGDLGFARRFGNSAKELSQTYCGSKSYAAPEILKGVPHDAKKSDVWAVGVIAYILLTGKMPFDESQSNRRIIEDQRRLAVLHWDRFSQLSPASRSFVDHALTFSYTKRPAVSVLLRHEWLLPHRDMIVELEQLYPSHNTRGSNKSHNQPALFKSQPPVPPPPPPPPLTIFDTSDAMVVCTPQKRYQQEQQSSSSSSGSGSSANGACSSSGGGGGGNSSGFSSSSGGNYYGPLRQTTAATLMTTASSVGTTSASTSSSLGAGSSGLILMAATRGEQQQQSGGSSCSSNNTCSSLFTRSASLKLEQRPQHHRYHHQQQQQQQQQLSSSLTPPQFAGLNYYQQQQQP